MAIDDKYEAIASQYPRRAAARLRSSRFSYNWRQQQIDGNSSLLAALVPQEEAMAHLFGEPPISAEKLSEDLVRKIDPALSSKARTQAVRETLDSIARSLNYDPVCSRKEPACSEVMLDQVWFPVEGDQHFVFAMECEWGDQRQVRYDFRKLLHIKAPLKMLVYTADDDSMRAAIHEQIKDALLHYPYHVEGECYAFVEFAPGNKCFRYKLPITKTGRLNENLEFTPLDQGSAAALQVLTSVVP
ncbi:MAG TPA: hypothetical protein VGP89_16815 [Candidatus Angelobacter sp.]|jgi:hypothetical protein|nr:hypothetical protein [Candidatus Angelobacter sp.]